MVHFAISNLLYAGNPTPCLLLGSIAPDAVHVRGEISREEKGVSHLVQNGKLPPVELITKKFKEYLGKRSEPEWKDFVVGYFTHIYADMRWTDTIYAEFEQAYTGENPRSLYYQEVSQMEFELQRSIKDYQELIRLLKRTEGYTIHPFVTGSEVSTYRDLKVEWLQNPHNEPHITPIYFDSIKVNHFIEMISMEIKTLLSYA
jgi:hypothetical protein